MSSNNGNNISKKISKCHMSARPTAPERTVSFPSLTGVTWWADEDGVKHCGQDPYGYERAMFRNSRPKGHSVVMQWVFLKLFFAVEISPPMKYSPEPNIKSRREADPIPGPPSSTPSPRHTPKGLWGPSKKIASAVGYTSQNQGQQIGWNSTGQVFDYRQDPLSLLASVFLKRLSGGVHETTWWKQPLTAEPAGVALSSMGTLSHTWLVPVEMRC